MVILSSGLLLFDSISLIVPVAILVFGIYRLLKLIRCKYPIEATVEEVRKVRRYARRRRKIEIAPGIVVKTAKRRRIITTYVAKCSYTFNGCWYESEEVALDRYYDEGENIFIHINPNKPTEAIKKDPLAYVVAIFAIGISISFMAATSVIKLSMSVMDFTKNKVRSAEDIQKSNLEIQNKILNGDMSSLYTNRPVDKSKYVKVNYHGAIKMVPKRYTEPIYPKNNKNSFWFIFKDKETGETQCKVTVKSYKGDVEKGMNNIAENVKKHNIQAYENVYRAREPKNNIPIRIDKAYGGNGFIYFAYWIHNGQYVLIQNSRSFEEIKVMATQSALYAD